MEPREEPLRRVAIEPREGLVHHVAGRAADVAKRDRAVLGQVEVVDVGVEPLVESPFRIEDERGHERGGGPAAALLSTVASVGWRVSRV